MDCEQFDSTIIGELYGELDELTLAASRRHAAGCSRCATLAEGLRATRKLALLPPVAPSPGFEDRLMAAVSGAQVPPRLRPAQMLSLAGRWAMRPQTAMAAVFLLILGTSSLLFSRKAPKSAGEASTSSFVVTENGAPAAPAPSRAPAPAEPAPVDPRAAAAAHGAASPAAPSPLVGKVAPGDLSEGSAAAGGGAATDGRLTDDVGRYSSTTSPGRTAPSMAPRKAAGPPMALEAEPQGSAPKPAAHGGFGSDPAADRAAGNGDLGGFARPPPPAAVAPPSGQSSARALYANGDFAGAARAFDDLAATGDVSAALWAARSVRDGAGGCSAAAARFDRVAATAWGSSLGYDATLEGAQCYARLGQGDAARSRYNRLITVPVYASRAEAGIRSVTQLAARARPAAPASTVAADQAPAATPAVPPPATRPAPPATPAPTTTP